MGSFKEHYLVVLNMCACFPCRKTARWCSPEWITCLVLAWGSLHRALYAQFQGGQNVCVTAWHRPQL